MKILAVLWLVSPATHGSSIFYKKVVHRVLQACEHDIDNYITSVGVRLYNFIWRLGSSGVMLTLSVFLKGHNVLIEQLKKMYEAHSNNSGRSRRSLTEAEYDTDTDDDRQDETLIEADDDPGSTEMSTCWSRLPTSAVVTAAAAAPTSGVSDVTDSLAASQSVDMTPSPRQHTTMSRTSAVEELRSTSLSSTSGSYFDKYVQSQQPQRVAASMSSTSAKISTTSPSASSFRTSSSPSTSASISTTLPSSSSHSGTSASPYRAVSTTLPSSSSHRPSSSPTTSTSISTTLPSSSSTTSSASLSYYERYVASRSSAVRTSSNYAANK